MALTQKQEELLGNITEDWIARVNSAIENIHAHSNKNIIDKVTAAILAGQSIQSGSAQNDILVYNPNNGQYEPITLDTLRSLLPLLVTDSEQTTLEGTWGVNEKGREIYNTTKSAKYIWTGSEFQ